MLIINSKKCKLKQLKNCFFLCIIIYSDNLANKKKKKNTKRRKLKIGRILIALTILVLFVYLIKLICRFPIKNIFIEGNNYLKDQEIIDLAKLQDYPSIFKYSNRQIEKNIKKSDFVKKVKVKKKKLKEVYIKIEENNILFYNSTNKKTILNNGKEIEKEYNGPILINYVPDKVYSKLIEQMRLVNIDIINRISEIKYDPSNVDEERFLFTMNDGNFVYITLEKLENINNYVKISLEIINKFGHKNGVLNLDAGEYFEIFNDENEEKEAEKVEENSEE